MAHSLDKYPTQGICTVSLVSVPYSRDIYRKSSFCALLKDYIPYSIVVKCVKRLMNFNTRIASIGLKCALYTHPYRIEMCAIHTPNRFSSCGDHHRRIILNRLSLHTSHIKTKQSKRDHHHHHHHHQTTIQEKWISGRLVIRGILRLSGNAF
jgi:hypothetical protein